MWWCFRRAPDDTIAHSESLVMGAIAAPLYAGSTVLCIAWTALALGIARPRVSLLPAAACAAAALWTGALAFAPASPLLGAPGAAEVVRDAVWLALLLQLYRRTGGPRVTPLMHAFAAAGGIAAILSILSQVPVASGALALPTFGSPVLLARIALPLIIVLLAENLYRNADEAARWHVNLPCIALGGLAAFDIVFYADGALSHAFSAALLNARAALTPLVVPLLIVAAVRDRRWRRSPYVSREVVFHGATLLVAGAFLVTVGTAGEALRHLGTDWGRTAQAGLLAGAVIVLAMAATSGSFRSQIHRLVVDHFFTARYDYRREWLRCVAALSAPEDEASATVRAIRAIADPVDSPAGVLLLRDPGERELRWAGSWNLPPEPLVLEPGHPLLAALGDGASVVNLAGERALGLDTTFGPLWLAVPLLHHREGLLGVALLAPPRAPFMLDGEVFDLLRTLGREVAMFRAERRAAERLADQRRVQDYAKRFAFVAHDVKTVASQLTLVLANADENIEDPEFQRDMLLTVRAAATRINTLIARLRQSDDLPSRDQPVVAPDATASVSPYARLRRIAERYAHPVEIDEGGEQAGVVSMLPDQFDAAVTHLLDNAVEASGPGEPVRIRIRREPEALQIDIIDRGIGMTADFIRERLFRPMTTSKVHGNGIGACQARELLREAGAQLVVLSRPGAGTTMRMTFPLRKRGRSAQRQLATELARHA